MIVAGSHGEALVISTTSSRGIRWRLVRGGEEEGFSLHYRPSESQLRTARAGIERAFRRLFPQSEAEKRSGEIVH